MPPEQASGQIDKIDERCDVFGLGAILCEVLTGKPPYVATEHWRIVHLAALAELDEAFGRLAECGADAELVRLVQDCLRADIEQRPRDAGVMAQRVAAYQRGVQERLRHAEQERATAQTQAAEERKRRWLAVALAGVVVLLAVAGGSVAWLLQQQRARQQEAAARTIQAVEHARTLLEQSWQDNDLAALKSALAEADRAVEIASGAADLAAQETAAAVQQEARDRLDRVVKDRTLLDDLLNIAAPPEVRDYQTDASGQAIAVAQPSVDEQYAVAFYRRWADLDLDHAESPEVVARLAGEPQPVVEEMLAGLDGWMLHRRQTHQPEAAWGRLYRLAEQLDHNGRQRQLRAVLAGVWRPPLGTVAVLGGAGLPWTALWPVEQGQQWRQVMQLRQQVNVAREPALSVVLLARACLAVGDAASAESVLRQAVTARPNEVVLLHLLGRLLEQRGRLGEAIEHYRAARGLRPQLGVAFGLALNNAGRNEEAEAVLRDLADKQPNNPELQIDLGVALAARKKFAEAEAAYRKSIALAPGPYRAHNNLGIVLLNQQKLSEAEVVFRMVIATHPGFAGSYNNLGNVLRGQQKLLEAEAAYLKAIEVQPDLGMAYTNLGVVLRDQKRPQEAEAAYRQAIDRRAENTQVHQRLGSLLLEQKKFAEAEAALQKAIALTPGDYVAHLNLGAALAGQHRPAEAEAVFRKTIVIRPDYALAHFNLGIVLTTQRKLPEAEAAYRKAIDLDPGYVPTYNRLGVVLFRLKKPSEAEAAFRKAIELQPDSAEAHVHLGNALLQRKKPAEAETAYLKATELKADFTEAHTSLGNALVIQKKLPEAEAAYRKAIELKPTEGATHYLLGNALYQQKKLPEAEAAYRKAIDLRPNLADAYHNLGNILMDQGKFSEAEAAFRTAIGLMPDDPRKHYNLGRALLNQKKVAEGEAAYRKADQLAPTDAALRENVREGLRQAQHLLQLDHKLAACLDGKERPGSPEETVELAGHAEYRDQYHAAYRFYSEALERKPQLADDLDKQCHYNAASAWSWSHARRCIPGREECRRANRSHRSSASGSLVPSFFCVPWFICLCGSPWPLPWCRRRGARARPAHPRSGRRASASRPCFWSFLP
jgi:tetratricopeptide (TPR) repeat protein